MPRPPRFHVAHQYAHVINRGNGKRTIFRERADYFFYRKLLFDCAKKHQLRIIHFILMPNHIHLLVYPETNSSIELCMHDVTLAYTRYFHLRYKTCGLLWQGRYKSKSIEHDAYFLECAQYIELNAVRAGIVSHPSRYSWSSYLDYTVTPKWIDPTTDPFYMELGATPAERRKVYQQLINLKLKMSPTKKVPGT